MAKNTQGIAGAQFASLVTNARGDLPIVYSQDIQGGLTNAANATERLGFPAQKLQDGMLVYQQDTSQYYRFDVGTLTRSDTGTFTNSGATAPDITTETNWTEIHFGGTPVAEGLDDLTDVDIETMVSKGTAGTWATLLAAGDESVSAVSHSSFSSQPGIELDGNNTRVFIDDVTGPLVRGRVASDGTGTGTIPLPTDLTANPTYLVFSSESFSNLTVANTTDAYRLLSIDLAPAAGRDSITLEGTIPQADWPAIYGNNTFVATATALSPDFDVRAGQVLAYNGTAWINEDPEHLQTGAVKAISIDGTNALTENANNEVTVPVALTYTSTGGIDITDNVTGADEAARAGTIRSALGSTTVGDALYTAADDEAARGTLGITTTGDAIVTAADMAAARTAVGATTVGSAVLTATDEAAGRTALGATTTGSSLLTAADAEAARTTLEVSPTVDIPLTLDAANAVVINSDTSAADLRTALEVSPTVDLPLTLDSANAVVINSDTSAAALRTALEVTAAADVALTLDTSNDVVINSDTSAAALRTALDIHDTARIVSERYALGNGNVEEWDELVNGEVLTYRAGITSIESGTINGTGADAVVITADAGYLTTPPTSTRLTNTLAVGNTFINDVIAEGQRQFGPDNTNGAGVRLFTHVDNFAGIGVVRVVSATVATRVLITETISTLDDSGRVTVRGNQSQTFSGTGSLTTFTLDEDATSITSVTVDGAAVIGFTFNRATNARLITFTTAPATGTNNIVVNYAPANVYSDFPAYVPSVFNGQRTNFAIIDEIVEPVDLSDISVRPWVTGTTYAGNDLVSDGGNIYNRRVPGISTVAPADDTVGWQRESNNIQVNGATAPIINLTSDDGDILFGSDGTDGTGNNLRHDYNALLKSDVVAQRHFLKNNQAVDGYVMTAFGDDVKYVPPSSPTPSNFTDITDSGVDITITDPARYFSKESVATNFRSVEETIRTDVISQTAAFPIALAEDNILGQQMSPQMVASLNAASVVATDGSSTGNYNFVNQHTYAIRTRVSNPGTAELRQVLSVTSGNINVAPPPASATDIAIPLETAFSMQLYDSIGNRHAVSTPRVGFVFDQNQMTAFDFQNHLQTWLDINGNLGSNGAWTYFRVGSTIPSGLPTGGNPAARTFDVGSLAFVETTAGNEYEVFVRAGTPSVTIPANTVPNLHGDPRWELVTTIPSNTYRFPRQESATSRPRQWVVTVNQTEVRSSVYTVTINFTATFVRENPVPAASTFQLSNGGNPSQGWNTGTPLHETQRAQTSTPASFPLDIFHATIGTEQTFTASSTSSANQSFRLDRSASSITSVTANGSTVAFTFTSGSLVTVTDTLAASAVVIINYSYRIDVAGGQELIFTAFGVTSGNLSVGQRWHNNRILTSASDVEDEVFEIVDYGIFATGSTEINRADLNAWHDTDTGFKTIPATFTADDVTRFNVEAGLNRLISFDANSISEIIPNATVFREVIEVTETSYTVDADRTFVQDSTGRHIINTNPFDEYVSGAQSIFNFGVRSSVALDVTIPGVFGYVRSSDYIDSTRPAGRFTFSVSDNNINTFYRGCYRQDILDNEQTIFMIRRNVVMATGDVVTSWAPWDGVRVVMGVSTDTPTARLEYATSLTYANEMPTTRTAIS